MAGIEDILGKHGNHHLRDKYVYLYKIFDVINNRTVNLGVNRDPNLKLNIGIIFK